MFICNECRELFEDPKPMREYHSEVDGYERYDVCPICGCEDIEEAYMCEECGEYITDDYRKREIFDLCKECEFDYFNRRPKSYEEGFIKQI